jgi:hypothetical protein
MINGCSVPDTGSVSGRAVVNAVSEVGLYAPLGRWAGTTATNNCSITHDDGQSDIAYVAAGSIDGNLGLTITQTDGCTFSWEEEHIVLAGRRNTLSNPT